MNLWYPQAVRWIPRNPKRRSGVNTVRGAVLHSAEGYIGGLHDVLNSTVRVASWHFSSLRNGVIEQHHPIDAVLWHAGSNFAHFNLIGIEHEGRKGEPLTVKQREASVELNRWIAQQGGYRMSRSDPKTLWEHNEVSDTPTECPSGRIPWSYYEEEEMSNAYIVEPGDSLGKIAQRFGTTVAMLAQINKIANVHQIEVGQVLRLSANAPEPAAGPDLKLADGHFLVAVDRMQKAWESIDAGRRALGTRE